MYVCNKVKLILYQKNINDFFFIYANDILWILYMYSLYYTFIQIHFC